MCMIVQVLMMKAHTPLPETLICTRRLHIGLKFYKHIKCMTRSKSEMHLTCTKISASSYFELGKREDQKSKYLDEKTATQSAVQTDNKKVKKTMMIMMDMWTSGFIQLPVEGSGNSESHGSSSH